MTKSIQISRQESWFSSNVLFELSLYKNQRNPSLRQSTHVDFKNRTKRKSFRFTKLPEPMELSKNHLWKRYSILIKINLLCFKLVHWTKWHIKTSKSQTMNRKIIMWKKANCLTIQFLLYAFLRLFWTEKMERKKFLCVYL